MFETLTALATQPDLLMWLMLLGVVTGFTDSTLVELASTINATVHRDIEPNAVFDQVLKHNPVLYRFWKKGPQKKGGTVLSWPILKSAKVNGGPYAGAMSLKHGVEDTTDSAYVQWRHYAEDVTVPKTDLLRASGINAKVELFTFKLDEAILNMRARVSQACYARSLDNSGNANALDLDNFDEAIDDGTNTATYAAQAHSQTFWKPGLTGLGAVNIAGAIASVTTLETTYSECTDGDEQPTLIILTANGFTWLWGQLQSLQRYTEDPEMTKAGFEAFKFNRATCVVDRNCTAQKGFLINERWVDFVSHEDENFVIDPVIPGTADQRVLNTKVAWSGQLRVKTPRYCGKLYGVTNW